AGPRRDLPAQRSRVPGTDQNPPPTDAAGAPSDSPETYAPPTWSLASGKGSGRVPFSDAARVARARRWRQRMGRTIFHGPFAGVILVSTLLAASPSTGAGTDRDETLQTGSTARQYHLHLPPAPPAGGRMPLVLVFHGG